jgi:hypothetical protein
MKRRIIKSGTPAEIAARADGYSGNGEGEHSRRAARGERVLMIDTVADLERALHRARVRASHHPERLVRQRAGEDARRLEQLLGHGRER